LCWRLRVEAPRCASLMPRHVTVLQPLRGLPGTMNTDSMFLFLTRPAGSYGGTGKNGEGCRVTGRLRHAPLGLLVVGLGGAGVPLDTAVNIAFPAITAAFDLQVRAIQWVVICYVLTYASLMLVFGKLGDLLGHRRIFQLGLVVGTVAFVLCSLAPSFGWLMLF